MSVFASKLKNMYGITLAQYEAMLETQKHVCAICGQPETRVRGKRGLTRLAVDHDHVTGKVRGLLCAKCNAGIGHFNDSCLLLAKAIVYLREHPRG